MIRVRAPAKLNVGLELVARRPDGYHEIDTYFVPLCLFDELDAELVDGSELSLRVDHPGIPSGPENLAWRAADRARDALGLERGVALRLHKEIPAAAGLGGGSSDAAAAILAVETLAGRALEDGVRRALARQLGADVPFFLNPGPMRGQGIGERLTPVPGVPALHWVLVVLPFAISTAEAYRAASRELTLPRRGSSIAALLGPEGVVSPPPNDLEVVAVRSHPEIRTALEALQRVGARFSGMSGSGPTVYGQFEDRAAAEQAAARIQLPSGARALAVDSPGSDSTDWGWGVAKW